MLQSTVAPSIRAASQRAGSHRPPAEQAAMTRQPPNCPGTVRPFCRSDARLPWNCRLSDELRFGPPRKRATRNKHCGTRCSSPSPREQHQPRSGTPSRISPSPRSRLAIRRACPGPGRGESRSPMATPPPSRRANDQPSAGSFSSDALRAAAPSACWRTAATSGGCAAHPRSRPCHGAVCAGAWLTPSTTSRRSLHPRHPPTPEGRRFSLAYPAMRCPRVRSLDMLAGDAFGRSKQQRARRGAGWQSKAVSATPANAAHRCCALNSGFARPSHLLRQLGSASSRCQLLLPRCLYRG